MMQNQTMLDLIERSEHRRKARRNFLKLAAAGTSATAGLTLLSACGVDGDFNSTPTPSPTATTSSVDVDVLNFALNLEYLEATFYSYAAFGTPLASSNLTGTGTQGTVTGGRQVTFTDPIVAQYAREIAMDESEHVSFLRSALGSSAVALPALNIDGSATGAFTAAARAAGVVSSTGTFDPYANDENFLLGAFIFEDVGVTAYKGASPLLVNQTYLEAAAGILAAEAYHAGLIRTILYRKGLTVPALRTYAGQISDARDSLDGSTDDDQGISSTDGGLSSNIVPTDSNSIAYSRTTGQVLNIVYLTKTAASSGGFFPAGLNGNIKTATAES